MLLSTVLAEQGRVRVYRGATVVDGTGADRYIADVAIEGARVVAIRRPGDADALVVPEGAVCRDATGLVLAPGFIDMHAHSDLAVLGGAAHDVKIRQGVTTEVIGQDGIGYAPLDDASAVAVPARIAGWNGSPGGPIAWRTMAGFLRAVDEAQGTGPAANVAVLVPQGNLRMLVIGHENRPASPSEIAEMQRLLGEALDDGAFGMSSGLTYAPGMYADTAELEALCRVVAERGGFWAPHTRSYGAGALDAFREALDVGRRTGCPIHLTHATMNFGVNRGRAAELIALIDDALADGVDVTLDTYPYLPGATTLAALLPSRLSEGGDPVGALRALDADGRERLRAELEDIGCDGFHGERADWAAIEIAGVGDPALADLVGRTVAQAAAERGRRAVDLVIDTVISDEGATTVLMHIGDEDNVREIMRHPRHTAGSDGILIGGKPHPRGFGTFPRYLGHYVRELGVLGLEEAVRHLSATPARRLGLDRGDAPRGVVREGATADLVLFDPGTVGSTADFDDPRGRPTGIVEVLVGGTPVLVDGEPAGVAGGRALCAVPPAHRATVPQVAAQIEEGAPSFELLSGAGVRAEPGLERVAALLRESLGLDGQVEGSAIALRVVPGTGRGPESFRVEVSADGVRIDGATAEGVFRGATVLRQLCAPERAIGSRIPSGTWSGEPAFGWRGMMLDVARHFRPVEEVRRLIDLLAAHHLNVLHLHLTDDQGWRYEVPGYPRLTEVGAVRHATQRGHGPLSTVEPGTHEGFYTAEELRDLVAYAAERFVTLVPEVELPGHVQAALAAYPALGNTDVKEPPTSAWERFGVNRRTLAPTEEALAFGRAAIDALCDVFDAEWIGIGGDEVPVDEWAASPAAAERMRELGLSTPHEVQPWFTRAFVAHVRARGRRALAWDEVLEGEVPEGVLLAAWRGPVALREALRRGIPVVACPDMEVYLDYPQSGSADEPIRVGPPLPIERTYTLEVPDGAIGGQANVWSEHLPTRERVDFAVFPRLSAIAERLWAGGAAPSFDGFAARLPVHLRRLAAAGVAYRPLDGPRPDQRRPGIPGKPLTLEQREEIVAGLVARMAAGDGGE
ncbi:family 20 glycosylhydrolase [Microbacterium sp.]|uniref:family 20 glycosylhydrolase n=1 Tax=Microbacterium sp. TaxID=51671 RepID=UPI003340884A